jgi:hypothetical protein
MFQEKRPGGWVPPSRGVDGSRDASNTKNHHTLQRRRWYPTKSSRDYDWKAVWQPIGKIAVERVLPQVQAARERDAKARAEVGLPPVDWDGKP